MEDQITTGEVAKKWGLIYGLISVIVNLTPVILEMQVSWIQIVNIVVAIVIYVLATKEFKEANGGFMSFGEGFKISIVASLIAGVLRSVINYVYVKFVDPSVTERIIAATNEAYRDQGMTEEQIQQANQFSEIFTKPEIGLILGIVVVLIGGLLWGAIVSAIIKNEKEDF